MADAITYQVLLVAHDGYAIDGSWVYRGEDLPAEDPVISIEDTLGRSAPRSARVARLVPDDIRARELKN